MANLHSSRKLDGESWNGEPQRGCPSPDRVGKRRLPDRRIPSRTGEHDNPACLMTGPFIQLSYQVNGEVFQVGVGIMPGTKQTTFIEYK